MEFFYCVCAQHVKPEINLNIEEGFWVANWIKLVNLGGHF